MPETARQFTFYEFFAGGGMARLGLGPRWECVFANDNSAKKAAAYRANFPINSEFSTADIAAIEPADLPGRADLAWASFPCQDLSLAGAGAGLRGKRSGTFEHFSRLIRSLSAEDRRPRLVVLENVVGALSSHKGRDFTSIISTLSKAGYRAGAIIGDAINFLPQSRPRLFIIAVDQARSIPAELIRDGGDSGAWHRPTIENAYENLPTKLKKSWVWWNLPECKTPEITIDQIFEDNPPDVSWNTPEQTAELISMMSKRNLYKLELAARRGKRQVGFIYKRTRREDGKKIVRAEARFDGISGCLRTPSGGSSRQTLIFVEGRDIRSRLLSAREAARLMGAPDSYRLPTRYNEAYHLMGDGLAVPVISWLEKHLLTPLASAE